MGIDKTSAETLTIQESIKPITKDYAKDLGLPEGVNLDLLAQVITERVMSAMSKNKSILGPEVLKFQEDAKIAEIEGQDFVEASMTVIKHYMPKWDAKKDHYFHYGKLRVYPEGTMEQVLADEAISVDERLHGKQETSKQVG